MARDLSGMSLEDVDNYYDNKNAANAAFQQSISTPEGMAAYNQSQATRWDDIQNHRNGYEADSWFDNFMGHLTTGIVDNIPLIYGALLTAGAAGAFGGAAEAGAAAGGAEAGLGGIAAEGGSAAGAGLGLGGGAAEAAGAGLGAIPNAGTVVISGAAGGAGAGGLGLGGIAAGVGAGAGLGSMIAPDGSPIQGPMQSVQVPGHAGGPSGLPEVAAGSAGGLLTSGDLGNIGIGALPYLNSLAQGSGNAPATGGVKPSLPGLGGGSSGSDNGLGGLLNGLGSLYGAYNDTKNNAADTEFYKNQLDQMTGMYKPGTPEATLMEQQMNAKDAAAGRNSQYGTRATNLAGALAQQRAQIMTSSAYQHTADMYRNKGAQNANPWLNALGQATQGGGGLGSIFGALGSGYNYLNGLSGGSIGNGITSGLGSLFGYGSGSGGGAPSMGSGMVDNILF